MKSQSSFLFVLCFCFFAFQIQGQSKVINGQNVVQIEYKKATGNTGILMQVEENVWHNIPQGHSQPNHIFHYQNRDEWSVYFTDSKTGERYSIDLYKKEVKYKGNPIAQIKNACTVFKPTMDNFFFIETTTGNRIEVAGGYAAQGANIAVNSPTTDHLNRNQQFRLFQGEKNIPRYFISSKLMKLSALHRLKNFGGKESNVVLSLYDKTLDTQGFRMLQGSNGFVYFQSWSNPHRFLSWNAENNLTMNTKKAFASENYQFKIVPSKKATKVRIDDSETDHLEKVMTERLEKARIARLEKTTTTNKENVTIVDVKKIAELRARNEENLTSVQPTEVTTVKATINNTKVKFTKVSNNYWMSESFPNGFPTKGGANPDGNVQFYTVDAVERFSVLLRSINDNTKVEINSVKKRLITNTGSTASIEGMGTKDYSGKIYKLSNIQWKMINEEDGSSTPEIFGKITVRGYHGNKTIKTIVAFNRSDKGGSRVVAKKGYVEKCSGSMIFAIPKGKSLDDFSVDIQAKLSDSDFSGNDLIGNDRSVAYELSNFTTANRSIVLKMRSNDGDIDVSCTIAPIN